MDGWMSQVQVRQEPLHLLPDGQAVLFVLILDGKGKKKEINNVINVNAELASYCDDTTRYGLLSMHSVSRPTCMASEDEHSHHRAREHVDFDKNVVTCNV